MAVQECRSRLRLTKHSLLFSAARRRCILPNCSGMVRQSHSPTIRWLLKRTANWYYERPFQAPTRRPFPTGAKWTWRSLRQHRSCSNTGWTLDFPPNWGAPAHVDVPTLKSWTEFADPGIRYFSGTATYRTTVHIGADQLVPGRELWLDLGEVYEVARIRINGTSLTPLWKHPYAARVDTYLHPGDNAVEVEVTNLWPNRLIGDAQPGVTHRYTWTNIKKFTASSPLLTSGMLGPVTLKTVYVRSIPLR